METESRNAYTVQEVETYLKREDSIAWVRFEDLLRDTPESCVDGRAKQNVVGVPGGNAGEFLLALAAADKVSRSPFNPTLINMAMRRYINRFGMFYMHTDEHVLEQMNVTEKELRNPSESHRERLLSQLVRPENIGCGHIMLQLTQNEKYDVRPQLVQAFLQEFYRELWRGNHDVELDVLHGQHAEGAVLVVQTDTKPTNHSMIPTVRPNIYGQQAFVYHPQMADYMREEAVEYCTEIFNLPTKLKDAYESELRLIGASQLNATLESLAKGLPIIVATFDSGRRFVVSSGGNV